jgi:uncharacterized protein with NRDE domain
MCLIVFSVLEHTDYPIIFAGNRDEFHGRPTERAHFWDDTDLLAGRDLKAGGTWLGVTRSGRFATVTNFREPGEHRPGARTRGKLVTGFLKGDVDARSYMERIDDRAGDYNGFNLILGDAGGLFYLSNRDGSLRILEPAVYGLSNGWLDTPWPKVRRAKALFEDVLRSRSLAPAPLLELLRDDWRPRDEDLPKTGLEPAVERTASSIFISDPAYGTRASTVVLLDRNGGVTFVERSFGPDGEDLGTASFRFDVESAP